MCKKGQLIDDAIHVLSNAPQIHERHALVNIGYTDIVNGITIGDFAESYKQLVKLCRQCGINPIITTILPRTSDEIQLIAPFNTLLCKTFSNVSDITGISSNGIGLALKEFFRKYV